VSEGVIAKVYRLLHAVLITAVEDGSIRANPRTIKDAGQHESDERPVATLAQVFALAEAMQPRYRLVVLLATFTSLRYGEIMGLRRGDFALTERRVKIDRAHIQPDTGPTFDGDPKAHSGRTVSLPALLVPEIEAYFAEFVGQSLDAYVFLGLKGARPARSNFHERMGHRSTRAALIYLHARDHRDRAIDEGLDAVVETAGFGGPQAVSDPVRGTRGHETPTNERQTSTIDGEQAIYQEESAERATGIEPAWPAWKAAPTAPSGASIGGQAGSQDAAVDRC
jgi:hypothetical protein